MKTNKKETRKKRHIRVRAKIHGTKQCPRFSVFRSNQHLYLQLIDDDNNKVIAAVSDLKLKEKKTGVELAVLLGKALAKVAKDQGISKVVFDRGGYKYHGLVKALAQAAREEGLTF